MSMCLAYRPTPLSLQPADRALFMSLKHYWKLEGRIITRQSKRKRLDKIFATVFEDLDEGCYPLLKCLGCLFRLWDYISVRPSPDHG